jgi:hypothetical protein
LVSKTYAQVIFHTIPVGATKTIPHHTEQYFFPGHPFFANGYAGIRRSDSTYLTPFTRA